MPPRGPSSRRGMGKLVSPSIDHQDAWFWTGDRFAVNSTFDEYPDALGTLPTAKSTHFGMTFWSPPGVGKQYPTCGDKILYICPKCGTWKASKRNCGRATCPVCFHQWAWKQAIKGALRIHKARRLYAGVLGKSHRPIHVMISLPESEYGAFEGEGYRKIRTRAYTLLKRAGILGGAMIPHPWRQHCRKCGGGIVGKWHIDEETGKPALKEAHCGSCGSEKFEWVYSPHFHIIGYGWVVATRALEAETGYVIKNIGIINNVGGTFWYQLTHCGLREGIQVVTWFGLCAYNKYASPVMPPHLVLCPQCKTIMVLYTGSEPLGMEVHEGLDPPWEISPENENPGQKGRVNHA